MRNKRTDRRELKAELMAAQAENAALKAELETLRKILSQPPAASEETPPPILSGGYPAKAAHRTPKSLKEAKEILMSSNNW